MPNTDQESPREPLTVLADEIERAARATATRRATILCNIPMRPGGFADLQPTIRVDGVIVVGDSSPGIVNVPYRVASTVIVLGLPVPSVRLCIGLARRGARSLVIMRGNRWMRQSLLRVIARRGARSAGIRLLQAVDRADARLAAGSRFPARAAAGLVRPGLAGARAVLQRMRPAAAYRALEIGTLAMARRLAPPIAPVAKRVVMFNSALAWGGAERQLVNTLIGLKERGYNVSLVCENLGSVPDSDFFAHELQAGGVEVLSLQAAALQTPLPFDRAEIAPLQACIDTLPQPFAASLWPYVAVLLARQPEIVHCWQDQTNCMAGTAATIVGVPSVVLGTRNMSPPNFEYHQSHMRETYRTLATSRGVRLLNNSRAGADDYAAWLGVSCRGIAVVHNGFAPKLFDSGRLPDTTSARAEFGIPASAHVVGSIFRFYVEKDPILWMEVAARVVERHPDTHFLLVGTGPLETELRRFADRLGLTGHLHMPGTMSDPGPAFAAMNVFLLTSRFEGLPNVLIEAQAHGVPVVSTAAGGCGETFIDGETGWLLDTRDPAEIAVRVCSVLENASWTRAASTGAVRQARERFGLEHMIDQTIDLYERAAGGTRDLAGRA